MNLSVAILILLCTAMGAAVYWYVRQAREVEAMATDEAFFIAAARLHKSGYATGEDATVVAALTLDALIRM